MKFVYWMGLQSPLILDKKPILKHIILSVAGRAEWTLCGGHEAGHRRAESPLCRAQPARGNFAADKSLTIDWIVDKKILCGHGNMLPLCVEVLAVLF